MDDDKIDDLPVGGLKMLQSRIGYRYTLDPFLLSAFCQVRLGERVVDMGTGSGIIPLLLSVTTAAESICGIEVQPLLAERARQNVALNGLQAKIGILETDLRYLDANEALPAAKFDVVLSNPPYRPTGHGRLAPDVERAACRHELHGGLDDFLQAAGRLLRSKGRFYLIFIAERLPELLAEMQRLRLEPKRIRFVHSAHDKRAKLALVEGRKDGRPGVTIEPPLLIYENGSYTSEVQAMMHMEGGAK